MSAIVKSPPISPGLGRPARVGLEHGEQALGFADVAIARPLVLEVLAGEFVEEADLTEHRPDAADLEHHPLDRLVARAPDRQG